MTHDIETLTEIVQGCLLVAAICSTSFPLLYLVRSKWRKTALGQLVMCWVLSYSLALDLTCLFTFWYPKDILLVFWIQVFVFGFIAITSALMTGYMLWLNFGNKEERQNVGSQEAGLPD